MINIASTQYTLKNKSYEIYLSGCLGNCIGCHNPELRSFNIGTPLTKDYMYKLNTQIQDFNRLIDNIWILGGEPLDQNSDELLHLLFELKITKKNIWLFTRYDMDEIPQSILYLCDYVKSGEYKENLKCDDNIQYGIKLATSNQKIYKRGVDY